MEVINQLNLESPLTNQCNETTQAFMATALVHCCVKTSQCDGIGVELSRLNWV